MTCESQGLSKCLCHTHDSLKERYSMHSSIPYVPMEIISNAQAQYLQNKDSTTPMAFYPMG
jgi:hypothetical protein